MCFVIWNFKVYLPWYEHTQFWKSCYLAPTILVKFCYHFYANTGVKEVWSYFSTCNFKILTRTLIWPEIMLFCTLNYFCSRSWNEVKYYYFFLFLIFFTGCGLRNDDSCAFKDIIPPYLYWECPTGDFLNDFIYREHAWVWALW